MLSRMGLSSRRARSRASLPQAYQSTGLSACLARYGLVSFARRFGIVGSRESGFAGNREPKLLAARCLPAALPGSRHKHPAPSRSSPDQGSQFETATSRGRTPGMDNLIADLRYALRTFVRNP